MRPLGLTALSVALLLAADPKDDAKIDLERFQGKWALISAQRDGKKTPEEEVKKITLTIQGNKFVLYKNAEIISEGTFTLDPTKRPKTIDETATAGPNKGKTFLAIYEIDDQHHKICFAAPGKERPTAFSSEPGSGHLLQEWKHEKRVELTGTLRTGIVAVGGETTGIIIETKESKYELDFGKDKELRQKAEKLNGKAVTVAGTLEIRKSVEVKERKIVAVARLEEAK